MKGVSIMIVRKIIDISVPLTEEEREEIRELKNRPIVYDEDCPQLTPEQLKKFKRVNPRRKKSAS